ncbi:MAG TPA: sigma-70 family RNA polymerase sigma factor [Chloroflexota bacterium]|jgi:RNA polymerase sigma-70 factor (ECF subfamily)|nr:sigma-70 family RNA polymerase sigma factor [Chloroflexota bacterium]
MDAMASDNALMRRVAAGDRSALAVLYDRHARAAYSLATRLLGAAGAEDVVHDAFVALVERPGGFDPERGAFRNWFLTVVHHRCLNQLRTRTRTTGDDALTLVADPAPQPVDAVLQEMQDASVRVALQRLPVAQQEVLILAYYGGMSQSALAARLHVPLGTVKARMRRGLLALRAAFLGDAGPAEEEATP